MLATAIVDSLKRALKARGITYAELATRIDMSEASVKRMFSQRNFTLQRLDEILQAAKLDIQDISLHAQDDAKLISRLTWEQEEEIINNPKLFIVAVSALNLIPVEHIVRVYQVTEAEVVIQLARLDKLGFLELLPNNRVKLLVSRTFEWIPDGPIQNYFRQAAYTDFLSSKFDGKDELMQVTNVLLSEKSIELLQSRLQQIAREFSQIHQEEAKLAFEDKTPITILLAARPWMPRTFKELVRKEIFAQTIAAR